MREHKSLFVLACQQAFAVAVVAALATSAAGVVELDIVPPDGRVALDAPGAGGTSTTSLVDAAPVRPTVRNVRIASGATSDMDRLAGHAPTAGRSPQRIRVVSPAEPVSGYATVGATWAPGQQFSADQIRISVRTLDNGGWSAWQRVPYDPAHEPDPGTDSGSVRPGTDAIVVGAVDKVKVRAVTTTGTAPRDLEVALVDPGADTTRATQGPAIDTGRLASADTTDGTATAQLAVSSTAPRPKIYSRAQWGADEHLRDPGSLHYGTIHAGFVHHTVNANDYARSQVPAIIRGIYAYHVRSRGWSDIGYNFLVDKFGRIWEGRYGGVARPVVGAHTLGYNDQAFAMSAIGNFETAHPSEAMVNAYASLFAWKLGIYKIRADDPHQMVDGRDLHAINGHRDVGQTLCPGKYLYARIPDIRRKATALQNGSAPPPPPPPTPTYRPKTHKADLSGAAWPDLAVRDKSSHHLLVVRTGGQVSFAAPTNAATGWDGKDLVAAPGDVTGDGVADFVARSASSGTARLYPGRSNGTVGSPTLTYDRFSKLDRLTGAGDFDGDGHVDLVGRIASTKQLVLFPGKGDGTFAASRVLASSWAGHDLTSGAGDLDGDGRADLVTRSAGELFLVPGRASGTVVPTKIPGTWSRYNAISGAGDLSGDGLADLVVRSTATGRTFIMRGDGNGGFTSRIGGFDRYDGARWLAVAGQVTGGHRPDLVTLSPTGRLHVWANTQRHNLGRTIDTGVVLNDTDLLLNVGDWNGDGRGDVITRRASTGDLLFRAGRAGNQFAAPVVATTGWRNAKDVTAVGDVNGDGHPDLMARRHDNTYVYPGNGGTGFKARLDGGVPLKRTIASNTSGYDWLLGPVDADGDGRGDVIARAGSTGALWLLPGTANGFADRRLIGNGFEQYDLGG